MHILLAFSSTKLNYIQYTYTKLLYITHFCWPSPAIQPTSSFTSDVILEPKRLQAHVTRSRVGVAGRCGCCGGCVRGGLRVSL